LIVVDHVLQLRAAALDSASPQLHTYAPSLTFTRSPPYKVQRLGLPQAVALSTRSRLRFINHAPKTHRSLITALHLHHVFVHEPSLRGEVSDSAQEIIKHALTVLKEAMETRPPLRLFRKAHARLEWHDGPQEVGLWSPGQREDTLGGRPLQARSHIS
jgi:hypothetical protein